MEDDDEDEEGRSYSDGSSGSEHDSEADLASMSSPSHNRRRHHRRVKANQQSDDDDDDELRHIRVSTKDMFAAMTSGLHTANTNNNSSGSGSGAIDNTAAHICPRQMQIVVQASSTQLLIDPAVVISAQAFVDHTQVAARQYAARYEGGKTLRVQKK